MSSWSNIGRMRSSLRLFAPETGNRLFDVTGYIDGTGVHVTGQVEFCGVKVSLPDHEGHPAGAAHPAAFLHLRAGGPRARPRVPVRPRPRLRDEEVATARP